MKKKIDKMIQVNIPIDDSLDNSITKENNYLIQQSDNTKNLAVSAETPNSGSLSDELIKELGQKADISMVYLNIETEILESLTTKGNFYFNTDKGKKVLSASYEGAVIPVNAGDKFKITARSTSNAYIVQFYSDYQYVDGTAVGEVYERTNTYGELSTTYENVEIEVPQGTKYMGVCSYITGNKAKKLSVYKIQLDKTKAVKDEIKKKIDKDDVISNLDDASENEEKLPTAAAVKNYVKDYYSADKIYSSTEIDEALLKKADKKDVEKRGNNLTISGKTLSLNSDNEVLNAVTLPTISTDDVRAELNTFIESGAITGITSNIYNVLDFGADNTGESDSTTAFADCIKAANGNLIIVPDGIYQVNHCVPRVDANHYFYTSVKMVGIGRPKIVRKFHNDTSATSSKSRSMFLFNGAKSVYISNITFDSQRDLFTADSGEWLGTAILYFFTGGANCTIENCTFTNCSREAIYCKGTFDNVMVRNCQFINTSANFWSTDGNLTNFVFEENYTYNCRTMAVEFDTANNYRIKNILIRNNRFEKINKTAVTMTNAEDVVIENNYYDYITSGEIEKDADLLAKMGGADNIGNTPYFVWCMTYADNNFNPDVNICKNIIIRGNIGKAIRAIALQPAHAHESVLQNSDRIYKDIQVYDNDFECMNTLFRIEYADDVISHGNIISGELTMNAHSVVTDNSSNVVAYDNTVYSTSQDNLAAANVSDGTLLIQGYKYTDICTLKLSADTTIRTINMIPAIGKKMTVIVSGAMLTLATGGNIAKSAEIQNGDIVTLMFNGSKWILI